MSNDLNHCSFIGRVGKDPEMKYGADGSGICNFSLAMGWKTKEKEGVEWARIVVFGKLAEICAQYLTKGKQVYVSGRMRTREYEKDGSKRYVTEIVADQMQMLGSKDDQAPARSTEQGRPSGNAVAKNAYKRPDNESTSAADMDSDIPF